MVIDFRYVFLGLWIFFTFMVVVYQMFRPVAMHRKWNWKNPHEKLMVASASSWILIFFAKGYDWIIVL